MITKLESLSNIYFKSRSQYIYPLPVDRTDNKQVFYNISILDEAIRKKQKVLFEYAEYHTDKKTGFETYRFLRKKVSHLKL